MIILICEYCGCTLKLDKRGCCASCGAPQTVKEKVQIQKVGHWDNDRKVSVPSYEYVYYHDITRGA